MMQRAVLPETCPVVIPVKNAKMLKNDRETTKNDNPKPMSISQERNFNRSSYYDFLDPNFVDMESVVLKVLVGGPVFSYPSCCLLWRSEGCFAGHSIQMKWILSIQEFRTCTCHSIEGV